MEEKITIKEAKIQLESINEFFEMDFEEIIKDLLLDGEAMSYSPYEDKNKDEIQRALIKEYLKNEDKIRLELIERSRKLQEIIDYAHGLQHILNMIQKAEIIESPKNIINEQIKEQYIKIEKRRGNYSEDIKWVYENFYGIDIENEDELQQAEQEGIFREMMQW